MLLTTPRSSIVSNIALNSKIGEFTALNSSLPPYYPNFLMFLFSGQKIPKLMLKDLAEKGSVTVLKVRFGNGQQKIQNSSRIYNYM
jgi:hypothetical protein